MKILTFIIGFLLLAFNIIAGKLLSAYAPFNMWANCVVIVANVILICMLSIIRLKDGFRVSLNFLFPFLGVIEFLSIVFCSPQLKDNGTILIVLLIILLQILLLLSAGYVSRFIQ